MSLTVGLRNTKYAYPFQHIAALLSATLLFCHEATELVHLVLYAKTMIWRKFHCDADIFHK